jgi:hypothetical protein
MSILPACNITIFIKNTTFMKKIILSLAIVTSMVALSSCGGGSGFEADIRKMAQMECDMEKLQKKADGGDEGAKKELEKMEKEAMEFGMKMMTKYKDKMNDKELDAKADKIQDEVKAACK